VETVNRVELAATSVPHQQELAQSVPQVWSSTPSNPRPVVSPNSVQTDSLPLVTAALCVTQPALLAMVLQPPTASNAPQTPSFSMEDAWELLPFQPLVFALALPSSPTASRVSATLALLDAALASMIPLAPLRSTKTMSSVASAFLANFCRVENASTTAHLEPLPTPMDSLVPPVHRAVKPVSTRPISAGPARIINSLQLEPVFRAAPPTRSPQKALAFNAIPIVLLARVLASTNAVPAPLLLQSSPVGVVVCKRVLNRNTLTLPRVHANRAIHHAAVAQVVAPTIAYPAAAPSKF
jgi:hypothetical protein